MSPIQEFRTLLEGLPRKARLVLLFVVLLACGAVVANFIRAKELSTLEEKIDKNQESLKRIEKHMVEYTPLPLPQPASSTKDE